MTEPTSGPWSMVIPPTAVAPVEIWAEGRVIARVLCNYPGITSDECRANARVIAAAHSLLAACEAMLATFGDQCIYANPQEYMAIRPVVELAEVAIQKARGE